MACSDSPMSVESPIYLCAQPLYGRIDANQVSHIVFLWKGSGIFETTSTLT